MLAPNSTLKPIGPYLIGQVVGYVEREPAEQAGYSSFKTWHALFVEWNWEQKAADWLDDNLQIVAYWPNFTTQVRSRGKMHRPRPRAVIPGLLFVPEEIMEIKRRDEAFEYAHSHGFIRQSSGAPACLHKAEIEIIREIEAKLNLPPERKGVLFKIGQEVRFTNEVYAAFWGTGIVFEIASEARIGVEVKKLFGRATKVYVPASEIEAM